MTTAEIHAMEQVEMTCDEIRQENQVLRDQLEQARALLSDVVKWNTLGKTTKIGNEVCSYLFPNRGWK